MKNFSIANQERGISSQAYEFGEQISKEKEADLLKVAQFRVVEARAQKCST